MTFLNLEAKVKQLIKKTSLWDEMQKWMLKGQLKLMRDRWLIIMVIFRWCKKRRLKGTIIIVVSLVRGPLLTAAIIDLEKRGLILNRHKTTTLPSSWTKLSRRVTGMRFLLATTPSLWKELWNRAIEAATGRTSKTGIFLDLLTRSSTSSGVPAPSGTTSKLYQNIPSYHLGQLEDRW